MPALLDLPSISFFGRSLREYAHFFAFEPADYIGRRVLDVAAGPSSFTAEAFATGVNAAAVDPLYGLTPDALGEYVQRDYAHMELQMARRSDRFRYGPVFPNLPSAYASRRQAADQFLGDYEAGVVQDRYIGGRLPHLPMADRSFELVLCAHLLFLYPNSFDATFHRQAIRELLRVARREVRIHPLCGPDGRESPLVAPLVAELIADGFIAEKVTLDYVFFPGTETTLILRHP